MWGQQQLVVVVVVVVVGGVKGVGRMGQQWEGRERIGSDRERRMIAGKTAAEVSQWSCESHMISGDLSADRRERPDPMRAPDPEDPSEEFSEESVTTLVSEDSKFQPPDDTTITLDNCEEAPLIMKPWP